MHPTPHGDLTYQSINVRSLRETHGIQTASSFKKASVGKVQDS
jgi:hypothetical protein